LTKRYGKGINTTCDDGAMIVTAFGHTQGIDIQPSTAATPTLRQCDGGAIAIVNALDRQAGGPDDNSAQAGHLIPFDTNFSNQAAPGGDTTPTLDTRGTQGVADVSPTLTKYNMDSRSPQSEEQQRIVGAVHEATAMVRRLTPVECERLMGWPDNWTAPDGVKASDSKRYAACGDGIVSHVAYWIGCRIKMIEEES
jgi:site-specific DNA-cytosine methylase